MSDKIEIQFPFEPFRVKVIETIKITTKEERLRIIENAHYNLFLIKAEDVMIDLLTDSGTGAMSSEQSASLITGDESYAGSKSFFMFENAVKNLTNFKFIFPVHQGRAAERILSGILCAPGKIVLSNGLFDTTRANIENLQSTGIDISANEKDDQDFDEHFQGNISLTKLEFFLKTQAENITFVIMTITFNGGGGQPVSLKNIKSTSKLCKLYKVQFFIDGCRFAENSYFIKLREEEYQHLSIQQIALETFSMADGMTMSAKKDGICHIGGWLAINDEALAEKVENILILTEGFKTYGGLAGRDMEAIAKGLEEVVNEDYLKYRIESVAYLGEKLSDIGVPIIKPTGGHAVYIDAIKFLNHIPSSEFPAQALAIELYVQGGIRSVEIGSLMFGEGAKKELLRLALPRRVYNKNHFDYIIQVFKKIINEKTMISGYEIVKSSKSLRHFTCHLKRKEIMK